MLCSLIFLIAGVRSLGGSTLRREGVYETRVYSNLEALIRSKEHN